MRKIAFTLVCFSISAFLASAQDFNKKVTDPDTGIDILQGPCTREALEKDTLEPWFSEEYSDYKVNEEVLATISDQMMQGLSVKIVLGTWCPDSQREVPRFFKIMDTLGVQESDISMICVDTHKMAPSTQVDTLNIGRVPAFIIYREGKELGRIIESPKISLEEDLRNILLY
jgi:hypothetical protein